MIILSKMQGLLAGHGESATRVRSVQPRAPPDKKKIRLGQSGATMITTQKASEGGSSRKLEAGNQRGGAAKGPGHRAWREPSAAARCGWVGLSYQALDVSDGCCDMAVPGGHCNPASVAGNPAYVSDEH